MGSGALGKKILCDSSGSIRQDGYGILLKQHFKEKEGYALLGFRRSGPGLLSLFLFSRSTGI